MTSRWLAVLATLAAAGPALAQPAPGQPTPSDDDVESLQKDLDAMFVTGGLTADQAAQRAAHVSPEVHLRVAEVDASIAVAEQAELQRVPVLQAKASFTRLSPIDPIVFGPTMFVIPENSYDLTATTVIQLSDYAARYPRLIKATNQAITAAKQSERAAETDAGDEARLAYYEWVRAKLQVFIAQRQLVQINTTLKQVQALAELQRLSKADLLRVESQEAQTEYAVDQLTNLASLREEQLRLLAGIPPGEPLAIGEDIRADVPLPALRDLDQLVNQATTQRPDIHSLDAGILAREEQREADEVLAYPHLSAFATAEDARPNQRVFPLVDAFRFTWSVGLQLTWTLGDTLVSGTNAKRLRAETNELRANREAVVRGARVEILAAQQGVEIAQRALASTRKGLVAAQESYRVRRELLDAGRATAVELVDSQTDLTRALISALNARIDLRVAVTQLSHALGDDASK